MNTLPLSYFFVVPDWKNYLVPFSELLKGFNNFIHIEHQSEELLLSKYYHLGKSSLNNKNIVYFTTKRSYTRLKVVQKNIYSCVLLTILNYSSKYFLRLHIRYRSKKIKITFFEPVWFMYKNKSIVMDKKMSPNIIKFKIEGDKETRNYFIKKYFPNETIISFTLPAKIITGGLLV